MPFGRVCLAVHGAEVLAFTAGGVAEAAAARNVTASTRFQISSVSKQWLAIVIGRLVERHLLDWQDPVARWFPQLPFAPEVTAHHLLTHTSGLPHWDGVGGWESFATAADTERIDLLARTPLRSPPGTAWHYSGPAYALLGQIAATVVGEPYAAILRREVFDRLGLTATTHGRPDEIGADVALGDHGTELTPHTLLATLPGTGDIWSTAEDLTAFAAAFQHGQLLGSSTRQRLLESSVALDASAYTAGCVSASRYAYGRYLGTLAGRQAWFHSGDTPGFQSFLGHVPALDVTVAVLCNADAPPASTLVQQTLMEAGVTMPSRFGDVHAGIDDPA